MRLRELPDVPPYRCRERDALRNFVNDFAEFFSTSASRGFRVLVCVQVYGDSRRAKCRRGRRCLRARTPGSLGPDDQKTEVKLETAP